MAAPSRRGVPRRYGTRCPRGTRQPGRTCPPGRARRSTRSERARPAHRSIALGAVTAALLDPLAPSDAGVWSCAGVRVRRRRNPHHRHAAQTATCTTRFCVQRYGEVLLVDHDLTPDELSDDLAVMLADELVDSGVLRGQTEFELVFTGVVRSTVVGGLDSWARFYRNSVARLEEGTAAFAPIHAFAAGQVRGRQVIDLGSCFGFFPLRLTQQGFDVLATDLSAPVMRLLAEMSTEMRRPLHTLVCDAADAPLPDGCADTVTALHLIEHLPTASITAVLDEAVRLARRRVIVAV
ncbi:MAG: class I SAM-dependent methyltransferase, partial [Mycobacterium sp.]|nr:class I SAM-dependent methyltransferase [Mycobacterium sp.]